MWHETEGGVCANQFASCLCHFIESDLSQKDYEIYSDGYPYHTRNLTLSNAHSRLAQARNIIVTHKFLEKGHTQMERFSVHHMMEEKIKKQISVLLPIMSDLTRSPDKTLFHTELSIWTTGFFFMTIQGSAD